MKKHLFYTELCYPAAMLILALGTALMEAADLGLSMIVAPAYLVHCKVSEFLPFFSFGMAEYFLQALLLAAVVVILRRARISYLFSFVTAVLYGLLLDGYIFLLGLLPLDALAVRILCFAVGLALCTLAVSLFFRTYIPPEAYELFVMELSAHFGIEIHRFKLIYDCVSCAAAVLLSLLFFGRFVGIGWGTVISTVVNGPLISFFTRLCDRHFIFRDRFDYRRIF